MTERTMSAGRLICLSILALALCPIERASATEKADAQSPLRAALIGTWELDRTMKNHSALKGFEEYKADGTFREVAISGSPGLSRSATAEGEWQLQGRKIIEKTTKASVPEATGRVDNDYLVSVSPTQLVIRSKDGIDRMHRSHFPRALPPPFRILSLNESRALTLSMPYPRYPDAARRRGPEGSGLFEVVADEAGKVSAVNTVSSTGSQALDDEAVATLRRWRFKRGHVGAYDIPITFKLSTTVSSGANGFDEDARMSGHIQPSMGNNHSPGNR